ncbi:A24 family peptidase [Loktanella sp. S4079]|uniref:A24 family peptidase n=1 Tax=Loktanella sp. S4079 TaxID=579483 RepID=UPI0005FA2C45|nr:prepilin peptidase [Loktanella sp. S4079]KJZ18268.1 hypothetical protein TW80_15135 [Loktanella sp. S4079]
MGLSAYAAYWFLPVAIPISLYVAWNDMRIMKIPNSVNALLLCSYAILGLFALPFDQYLWQWLHAPVVLVVGVLIWGLKLGIGAGDVKFMTAASPMISADDWYFFLVLYISCLLASVFTVFLAKLSPLRKLSPDWKSLEAGEDPRWYKTRLPKGLALGGALSFYLLLVAIYR